MFEDEVASLSAQRPSKDVKSVKKQSDIYCMDPFIGEDGLLRVGGRTRRSDQPLQVVHPVILPKDHHVTWIIIGHFYERTKHSGRGISPVSMVRLDLESESGLHVAVSMTDRWLIWIR